MAECNSTMREPRPFLYEMLDWGDLIYGTKDELQALGIATDVAFPGEIGGPKRILEVIDPRGFHCKIKRWRGSDTFGASIVFPGRELN
ncbi:MAG: hypothetical protein NT159_04355, partial [Proteobacteria bacterium]|nr:hypothetical protein [Pseudomonadota bacterium]